MEEETYIPVYILRSPNKEPKSQLLALPPHFRIMQTACKARHDIGRFQEIIKCAQQNEDDVILVLNNYEVAQFLASFDLIYKSIYDAIDIQAHFVLVSGQIKYPYVQTENGLLYITEINKLEAFVVTRVLYELILAIDVGVYNLNLAKLINKVILRKLSLCHIADPAKIKKGEEKDHRINVIVPFRNCRKYIRDCMQSILQQSYKNYRVFFVDDCSTDNGLKEIIKNERFITISNQVRKYALENIFYVLNNYSFSKEDINIILDGDDMLAHDYVFKLLNSVYNCKRCLLTYGSFRIMNNGSKSRAKYSRNEFAALRKVSWKASHLKTFRYELFDRYKQLDVDFLHMKDPDGKFYRMTYDIALMFPLMELAGFNKVVHISEPLYLYRLHEENDHYVNRKLQYDIEVEIRNKDRII